MTNEGELIAGRYRVVAQVGTGAMGVVWQARDERLHRTVAVKQLLLHSAMSEAEAQEATRRAMREARITARLHHPHAISVYDVAEHEGKPCLIMEYLPADSLSAILALHGALEPGEVARIGSQIAAALVAAHEVGIVHRDVKPGNVLISADGTTKITDFGISRATGDSTVTATGILPGTPAYFAPEVAKGQHAGFPADVFSLGATLYTAVEGIPPFGLDDNTLALLYRIATSDIAAPQQAGPLTPVLERLLELDPARRPTMQQAQEALSTVADLPPSPVTGPVTTAWAPARSSPATAAPQPTLPPDATAPPAAVPPGIAAASAPSGGVSTSPGTPAPRPPLARRIRLQGRHAVAAAVVMVSLTAAGGIAMTMLAGHEESTVGHAPAAPPAGPATSTQTTTTQTTTTQTTPSQSPPSQTTPSPAETTAQPAPTPDSLSATESQNTPKRLETAIVDYYALMPSNLQAGWPLLTVDYQRNHAKGFGGYQAFWAPIQRVDLTGVKATAPGSVTATISYFYPDGRVVEERTTFGLVFEDGRWKIGSSTVNSSRAIKG